ncbi:MAG: COP23 domain-containing protein, partial [Xenococcaceae cyanobacterium]
GTINKQPVICVADNKGGSCPDRNVLITLESGANPEEILIKLIDFRRSVAGNTIVLSDDLAFYSDREFYVDINQFLDKVPVEE